MGIGGCWDYQIIIDDRYGSCMIIPSFSTFSTSKLKFLSSEPPVRDDPRPGRWNDLCTWGELKQPVLIERKSQFP